MRIAGLFVGLLVVGTLIVPSMSLAETAEQAAAKAKALLAKGDFDGALAAYGTAARADSENRAYAQQYTLVRRVLQLRERLDAEQDPQRWQYLARGLHAFYVGQGLYNEALALDKRIHGKLNDADSAVLLAETQLAMELNAEAAGVLSALNADRSTPTSQALLGIALARQDKLDEARQVAAGIQLPKEAGPRTIYTLARLQAKTGSGEEALKLLARCFRSAAPSVLEGYKTHASQSPDFEALASTAAFAAVLKTRSAVPQSQCSGGSGCAGCPMRGKCAHSQGAGQ